jgi:hypothetical protein
MQDGGIGTLIGKRTEPTHEYFGIEIQQSGEVHPFTGLLALFASRLALQCAQLTA